MKSKNANGFIALVDVKDGKIDKVQVLDSNEIAKGGRQVHLGTYGDENSILFYVGSRLVLLIIRSLIIVPLYTDMEILNAFSVFQV